MPIGSTQASPGQRSHAASWRWNLFWSIQQHYCSCSSDKNYDGKHQMQQARHPRAINTQPRSNQLICNNLHHVPAPECNTCPTVCPCHGVLHHWGDTCHVSTVTEWIVGTFRRSRHLMLTFINKTLFLATLYIISTSSSLQHLLHSVFIFLSNM